MDEHQLDQLGFSLAAIVASLRGRLRDGDDNDSDSQDAALATTLSGVVEGLGAIRASIGDIVRILAEHRKESCRDEENHGEKEVERADEGSPAGFHGHLNICVTGCRAVLEKLDGVAAGMGTKQKVDVYDSDWESVAESADGSQLLGRGHEEVLTRVEAVIGPLGGALGILLGLLNARGSADQQALLGCSTTRDIFRRLEQRLADLAWKNEGKGQRWSALLKPLRLLRGKAGSSSTSRLRSKPSKPSLSRAKTWPTLFKGTTDPEEEEARRRSALIDKQIEEQAIASRNTCTILIMWGRHAPSVLLTDTFARLSTKAGVEEAPSLPAVAGRLREKIWRLARSMVWDFQTETGEEEEGGLAITKRLTDLLGYEGEEPPLSEARQLMEIWNSQRPREPDPSRFLCHGYRLPEFDDLIVEAFRRSTSADFAPTAEDYRRFFVDREFCHYSETFNFESDPIAVRILDHKQGCGFKTRYLFRLFYQEATSVVIPFNLAEYDMPMVEEDDGHTCFTSFLDWLQSLISARSDGTIPSAILIFYNVKRFLEKLKRRPMSSLKAYKNYAGGDDPRSVIGYMMDKCREACQDKRRIYPHVGELWDESTVKFIRMAAKESMLHSALKETGLF